MNLNEPKGAVISECERYRYLLWRRWAPRPYVVFIGLNPSTADANLDDPTIRRCIGFAKSWGFGGIAMVNLFAYRATKPKDMLSADEPIGPCTSYWMVQTIKSAGLVVCAWGAHGEAASNRVNQVLEDVFIHTTHKALYCLGTTVFGSPRHPLYIKKDEPLELFRLRPEAMA